MKKSNQQIRLDEIDRRLRKKPEPTFNDLAMLPHSSRFDEKTLRRDLKDLENIGAPISKKRVANKVCYFYTDPSWKLQKLSVSASDMLYLTLARQAISQFSNSLMVRKISAMLDQLQQEATEETAFSREQIERAVTFDPAPYRPVDMSVWNMLLYATLKRNAVELLYRTKDVGDPKPKKLFPYHMVCLEGDWYILAGAPGKPVARQYNLSRVTEVRPIPGEKFGVPAGFDAKELIANSFGRFIADGPMETMRVRVSGSVATYVKNHQWHARQAVKQIDEETMEISFPVSADGPRPFGNVASWVLSLGPSAEVVAPPRLKDRVIEEAKRIVGNYC